MCLLDQYRKSIQHFIYAEFVKIIQSKLFIPQKPRKYHSTFTTQLVSKSNLYTVVSEENARWQSWIHLA